MITITANDAVQAFLGQVKDVAELRDTNGQVLGYFTPREQAEELLYQQAEKLFDPEEMKRRKAEKGKGYSIEEVMEHLQSLGASQ